MELRNVLALRGPNIWAGFPVLEAWVDLGPLKDSPSDELPGFNDRLMSWLPSLVEHRCSIGERGGFFERLRRGTWQAHILEHVTLELQSLAGSDVGFGRARETSQEGVYKVAIEYEEEELARACLEAARQLCLAAVNNHSFDVAATVSRLRSLAQSVRLGPSTRAIVEAARRRGIPFRRLNRGSLVLLGHGAQQRRVLAAETDRTGAIAESIAQDKELTRTLLSAVGVPVPEGRAVADAADAWAAAEEIGLPVVVKPRYGNQGRGVAANLATREQVTAAFAAARKEGAEIIVERYVPGGDYRLLVVDDRLVAAARREPAKVIGDGKHTVAQLVEAVNADPRRGDDHATSLSKIRLDAIAEGVLAEQGFSIDSILPDGLHVLVRRNANLSTGGTASDVTDYVHPQVASRAIEAARMVGLDVAGVDVVTLDIGRPLEELGGAIVEVNAAPGLRMHLEPSAGTPRPVGEAIVARLFPAGKNGRIPIVAVTGVNGKTTTTRFIAHLLSATGATVGMSCTEGVFIGGRQIDKDDCSGPLSARNILLNPSVEMAVLETARGGILREGLGFDACQVAVVTNLGEGDHLGLADIDTLDKLARVKRTIVEALLPGGAAVLNAEDPLVAGMSQHCKAEVVYFGKDASHPVLVEQRRQGGRSLFVRNGEIILAEGAGETALAALEQVPLTHGGRIAFQVENTLAATAAAWSLGISPDAIRRGLQSFGADLKCVPGRFNLFDFAGTTVVVDYGHNASSLKALIEALAIFPHERRSIVYSTAGDRRDADMVRQGELLAGAFDRVHLYEDHYLRGRRPGEIIALLRQGLALGSRVAEVYGIQGALQAVEAAIQAAAPAELLVIQADRIDEMVDYLRRHLAGNPAAREITLDEALAGRKRPRREAAFAS